MLGKKKPKISIQKLKNTKNKYIENKKIFKLQNNEKIPKLE